MPTPHPLPRAGAAVLTLAEIKAAAAAFDRGDISADEALDAVIVALEGYRAVAGTNAGTTAGTIASRRAVRRAGAPATGRRPTERRWRAAG